MLDRLAQRLAPLRTYLIAGAWFFIAVSLAHLLWVIGTKWGDPAGATKLYHTVIGGRSYDAWALTYTGTLGLLVAIAQALVVSGAAVASGLTLPRTLRWRRAGHLVLSAWASLWALNLIRIAGLDHQLDSIAQATLLSLLFCCTTGRAITGWSPERSKPQRREPGPGEPVPQDAFDRVLEVELVPMPPREPAPHMPRSLGERLAQVWARIERVWSWILALLERVWGFVSSHRVKQSIAGVGKAVAAALKWVACTLERQAERFSPST